MQKPTLSGRRYEQGKYRPRNPQKYLGDPNNILYRSSWEHLFCRWCDTTPSVLRWTSETIVVPYVYSVDGKEHRYFIDFAIIVQQADGTQKKFLVEIKPFSQTQVPKPRAGMKQEAFNEAMLTYAKNQDKWKAAQKYARSIGAEFIVLTEKTLLVESPRRYRRKKQK